MIELYVCYTCSQTILFNDRNFVRIGWDWNLGLIPYGPYWRAHRRSFSQFFNSGAVQNYSAIQEEEIVKVLKLFVASPEGFIGHIRL